MSSSPQKCSAPVVKVSDDSVKVLNGHPAWKIPRNGQYERPKLFVRNSLTDTKEPLIPSEGNVVRMYICGPTVYSVSHMGHARTFLSFDIIRRILEKYFHFNVLYQMNITDIDDKIILTARKNELVRLFLQTNPSMDAVHKLLGVLIPNSESKLVAEKGAISVRDISESSREFAERDVQLKQIDLKLEQLATVKSDALACTSVDELVSVGKDLIANHLDAEKGSEISDKAIFESHSRYYEKEFLDDCENLKIRPPDVLTRVTEYVPEIVEFVSQIIRNGYAYESAGSVYFDTQKFKIAAEYPKLVPQAGSSVTDAEMAEGEGALSLGVSEKKHKNDFALWKKSKGGEPRWDSPWGSGRPGWHIECSVMATAIHGKTLDIHCGGVDLKFPHHDNEIAQTEAHYEIEQWTNYFLHAGHLHIKGLKMAKSLKNFITIRQALEKFSAKQIRLMFLLQQWDKPVNFSDQTLDEAREKENRINSFLARIAQVGRNYPMHSSPQKWDELDSKLSINILDCQERVHSAMCDNFDTPSAMEAIECCIGAVNNYLADSSVVPKFPLLVRARDFVEGILSIWGIESFVNEQAGGGRADELANELVLLRDKLRAIAAATKNTDLMNLSDELRDETFVNLGIKVLDSTGKGAECWSFVNPADLRKEQELKKLEKAEKEFLKIENKKQIILKEIEKLSKFQFAKTDSEILFPDCANFDADGIPTDDDISSTRRKSLKKDLDKLRKERAEYETKGGQAYLEKLQSDVNELERRVNERK